MGESFQKIKQKLINDFYLQSSLASAGYAILLIFLSFVPLLEETSEGYNTYLYILWTGILINLVKLIYALYPKLKNTLISNLHVKIHLLLVLLNCLILTFLFSHSLNHVPSFQNEFWFIFFLINIINTASAFSVVISPITVFLFIGILGIVPPLVFYFQIDHVYQLMERNSLFILFFSFIYNLFLMLRARAHQKMIIKIYRYEEEIAIQTALASEAMKLSAIGEMAGGIAHEINNPLAIIYHHAKKLQQHFIQSPEASTPVIDDKFKKIIDSIKRIDNVINGLKTYAQSNRLDKSTYAFVSFKEVMSIAQNICKNKIETKNIRLEFNSPEINIKFFANKSELSQVLVHLLNNSIEAIDHQNGLIKIDLTEHKIYYEISISDNGSGIDPSIVDKIFIPFYTTKDSKIHHGIGLSTSQAIIDTHGGDIRLLPITPLKLTTFIIRLPKVTE